MGVGEVAQSLMDEQEAKAGYQTFVRGMGPHHYKSD